MAKKNDSIFNFDNLIILFFLIILVCCLFKNRNIIEGVDGPTCKQEDGSECTATGYDPANFLSSDPDFATKAVKANCPAGCQFNSGSSDDSFFSGLPGFPDCSTLITGTVKAAQNYSFQYFIDVLTSADFNELVHCACETDNYFINPTTSKCELTYFANHCENDGAGGGLASGGPSHMDQSGNCVPTHPEPSRQNVPGCSAPTAATQAELANIVDGNLPTDILPARNSDYATLTGVTCKPATLSETEALARRDDLGYCLPKKEAMGADQVDCQGLATQDACAAKQATCNLYPKDRCVSVGCTEDDVGCADGQGTAGQVCEWVPLTGGLPSSGRGHEAYAYCPLETARGSAAGGQLPYEIVGCPLQTPDKLGGNPAGEAAILVAPSSTTPTGGGGAGAGTTAITGQRLPGELCLVGEAVNTRLMCAAGTCEDSSTNQGALDAIRNPASGGPPTYETPDLLATANGICSSV